MSFPTGYRHTTSPKGLGRCIGEGNFCQVFECVDHDSAGIKLAVKLFEKQRVQRLGKFQDLLMEKHALSRLDHVNIVKLYGTANDATSAYIYTELCGGGEWWPRIRFCGEPEIRAKVFFKQIISAVAYMHRMGIVHCDLKAENLFLSSDLQSVKVGDFGSSRDLFNPKIKGAGNKSLSNRSGISMEHYVGTPNFMSPEAIANKENDDLSDIWSLGCLFYQVLVGLPPFIAGSEYLVFVRVRAVDLLFPPGLSESSIHLVESIVKPNRADRPTLDWIKSHSFLTESPQKVPPWSDLDHLIRDTAQNTSQEVSDDLIGQLSSSEEVRARLKRVQTVRDWERQSRPGAGTGMLQHLDLGVT